ncbi:MAG: hypothetical protein V8S42_04845 [Lachnospiraceae bacterium]
MTDNAALLQNKEAFRNTYGNQEGFNMCQALDELMADKMNEGIYRKSTKEFLSESTRGFLSENVRKTRGFLLENVKESTKGFSWRSRTVKLRSEPLFPICWLVVFPAKISAGFWNVILLLNRYGKASPSTIDNAALLQNKEAFRNT